jgi:hypothetical protein
VTATATAVPARASRAKWMHRAGVDVPLGLAWVPFCLAALLVRGDADRLNALVGATLLFSLAHQPLTLGLVYGDKVQFNLKRPVFILAPFAFAALLWVGLQVSFVLVAIIAALWNAEHTLMQRYGISRIYGRKAGDDHGHLEKVMLFCWLGLVLVWAAADPRTAAAIDSLRSLGARNAEGIQQLVNLRPAALVVLPVAVVAVLVTTGRWVAAERRLGEGANTAKHLYLGLTALLFGVMLLDPIVGFVGYVGAHAAEYFAIIHQTLGKRYADGQDPSPVGRAARSRLGQLGTIAALLAGFAVAAYTLRAWGSPRVYTIAVLSVGAMHIFYDGFIWKLRRPEVARSFEITPLA